MKTLSLRTAVVVSLLFILFSPVKSFSQGIAVNTSGQPADTSAIFDANSHNKGMLVPRMTTAERNAIAIPANGLLIFNITTNCFNFYKSGGWFELCGNCVPPAPPAVGNNSPRCAGDTLKLTATYVAGYTYSWSGPNGFSSTAQNPVIPNAGIANTGMYSLIVTNSQNCVSNAVTSPALILPVPLSTFTSNPAAQPGQSVTFTPTQGGASFYLWGFQGGSPSTSTAQSPVVTWAGTGSYTVSLQVTNTGCSSTTTSTISVQTCTHGTQTFYYTGTISNWTVPASACLPVTIEVWGAQGGNSGGLGARMKGEFSNLNGQTLKILVGGEGNFVSSTNAGGGGGSFVTTSTDSPIIIAGGGGGNVGSPNGNMHASIGTSGVDGYSPSNPSRYGIGGTNGSGGGPGGCAAAGGGLLTDGAYSGCGYSDLNAGKAFINGGAGGNQPGNALGGFGGGGGGGGNGGGGGGGYSGGGGSYHNPGNGGGGGSYNSGANQSNSSQVQSGSGQVIITW